jgi:hypothetical protein
VKQNLTLTLEADLLKAARKLAIEKDTSVNQMVRDFLMQEVNATDRHKRSAERMKKMFKNSKADIGSATWTRDELYDL